MMPLFESWRLFLKEEQNDDIDVVSKVIIKDKDKILILKRAKDMDFGPEKWDLPGGHLKKGENNVKGAKRETKEETDLEIKQLDKIDQEKNITFYKTNNFSGKIKLDKSENSEFKWITAEELDDFDILPLIKKAIKQEFSLEEDYQADIKQKHQQLKKKNIGLGGNTYNVADSMKKPSFKRAKSAPAGAGGS